MVHDRGERLLVEASLECEALRLAVSGRERMLRLRIRNRDDRPLSIRGVTVMVPEERVGHPGPRLRPGPDDREPPGLGGRGFARAGGAGVAAGHPALRWGGLLAVVAALGALTWRALKAAR